MSGSPRPARSRLFTVLALGLVALLGLPARAAEEWLTRWETLALQGLAAELDALLTDARLADLGTSDEDLLRCLFGIEEYGAPMSRTHPEPFGRLLDRLHGRAVELAAAPDSRAAYRTALSFTTAMRCRHRHLNALKTSPSAWREAAERIAAMHDKLEALAHPTLRAAAWLGEVALLPGEDPVEPLARAKAVIDAVAARVPEEERLPEALGDWYVTQARAGRIHKRRAYGKAAVVSGLAFLESQAGDSALPPALATVRARLVAENQAGRFGVKVDMVVVTRDLAEDGLVFEIPACGAWAFTEGADVSESDLALQRMRGDVPRRKLGLMSWERSEKIYVDRDRTSMTAVTNPKKLAQTMLAGFHQFVGIKDVQDRIQPHRVKLHKDFTDAWRIGVAGYTGEKRWMRAYGTYFKSKKSRRTYNLVVYEYQNETDVDPVVDFVIRSMRLKK